jgi:hypothetical protein
MRRKRGEVEKERLGRILPIDQLHRIVPDERCVVTVLLKELSVTLPINLGSGLRH